MNRHKYRKIAHIGLVLTFSLSLSGCGLFRKGCKCPPVHRYSTMNAPAPTYTALAMVTALTLSAPSFSNASAQASMVAPVVSTSSTSNTCLPEIAS